MQLEDYFDFLRPDDIRIKGHRIGIETVLYEYLFREKHPEEIQQLYSSLNLEEIYATILYYLHNREQVDAYLTDWLEWSMQVRKEQERNPSPAVLKLRRFKMERRTIPPGIPEA